MAATSEAAPARDIGRPHVNGPAWPRGWRPPAAPHRVGGLRASRARAQRQRRAGRVGRHRYSFDLAHKVNHQYTFPATPIAHPVAGNTLSGLTANTDNELLNPAPGQALTYNADGYLVSDSQRTYSYDSDGDGHILSVTQGGSTIGGYRFDVFGRRIAKTASGNTTQYLLDDQGHEIGEYDGSGTLLRYLVYDPFQTAPVVALDPMGNPSYIEVDRTGSVVATSSGATLANTYAYLPYGDTPSGTLSGTAFGYGGYRFDTETGTYHTATRQYDPRLGRFLQSDPIGQAGDKNIYAYAGGDPINGSDPSGTYAGPFGAGCDGCGPQDGTQGSQGVGGGTAPGSGYADHGMTFGGLSPSEQSWSGSGTVPLPGVTQQSYNQALLASGNLTSAKDIAQAQALAWTPPPQEAFNVAVYGATLQSAAYDPNYNYPPIVNTVLTFDAINSILEKHGYDASNNKSAFLPEFSSGAGLNKLASYADDNGIEIARPDGLGILGGNGFSIVSTYSDFVGIDKYTKEPTDRFVEYTTPIMPEPGGIPTRYITNMLPRASGQ